MDKTGKAAATPINTDPAIETTDWLEFSSGYVQRALSRFPRQATIKPWRLNQNYAKDMMTLRFSNLDDGVLKFSDQGEPVPESVRISESQTEAGGQPETLSTNTVPAE